ncbi:hypothetical protein ABZS86_28125 [Streptomyces sp. NPDC005355]
MAALAGCGASGGGASTEDKSGGGAARGSARADRPGTGRPAGRPALAEPPRELPGLGPRTRAEVPKDAEQVVVVTGADRDS